MKRDWKPGDVAAGSIHGYTGLFIFRGEGGGWDQADGVDGGWDGRYIEDLRPLVVIDPEDRDQVERLTQAMWGHRANILQALDEVVQAALREFANPAPSKPEVYEHIAATLDQGVTTALCGKVWRAGEDVKVVGKCPECSEMVETGWIA